MSTPPTIVIPVRNEGPFLEPALEQITAAVRSACSDYRMILVENGSADDTFRQATALAENDPRLRVLRLAAPGYGAAVRRGMEEAAAAGGEWIILFHLDLFSGEFISRVLGSDADLVTISAPPSGRSRRSRLAAAALDRLARLSSGTGQGVFRGVAALRVPAAETLLGTAERSDDLFTTELLMRAELSGLRTEEVPVAMEELRPPRRSLRILRGLRGLRRSLRRNPPPAV